MQTLRVRTAKPQLNRIGVDRRAFLCRAEQRSLLLAVDDHQRSYAAVQYTLEHIHKRGDVIVLLHVISREASSVSTPPVHAAASVPMGSMESLDLEDEMAAYATRFMQPMINLVLKKQALVTPDIVRADRRESIGRTICRRAEKLQPAMVILAGRAPMGLWGQLPFVQGESVAAYVAANSPVPTLVTRHAAKAAAPAAVAVKAEEIVRAE